MSVKSFKQKTELFESPVGSPDRKTYSSKIHDDGSIELIESGKEDWYGYIQSFADEVDINTILRKAAMGDVSGLQKVQGFYADATTMPKSYSQLLQMVIDGERNFEQLPIEIRQKFDNDFYKFFSTMDTKEWFEKMKMTKKTEEVQTAQDEFVSEVKE